MTIKNLYPTQRPALDLNFANSKRLDPRVSLTRASVGTYVGNDGLIKTAVDHEPRFDHDPLTGESLGLLVEEARTNSVRYSSELNNTSVWTASDCQVIPNSAIAPDGTMTADTMKANSGLSILPAIVQNAGDAAIRTLSIYAKMGTYQYLKVNPRGNQYGVVADLSDGSIYAIGNSFVLSTDVIPAGNGWYRVILTTSITSATRIFACRFSKNPDSNTAYDFTGDETVYLWGAQLETGSFPTSYIPTSGSTVTRAADVASLTNTNVYDTDSFTILNNPYGAAAGGSTLNIVGGGQTPVKRTTVYNQDLSQSQINTLVKKDDEFWRWRILGSSFALPNFLTDGQVTVDWGDGTVETMTTSEHTFSDGGGYHDVGFRLDSGTYFRPNVNNNGSHDTKVVAFGPAPVSMKLDANSGFYGCSNLEAFDATVDTSSSTSFYRAWDGCSSLTSFPLIDTSGAGNFRDAWQACSSLTSFPLINTSAGTSFYTAWDGCSSLTSFPLINTSAGTDFTATWRSCSSLTSFPLITTSAGTNFAYAWQNCSSLTSFPLIDTSSATNLQEAWKSCSSLTSFPLIDTSSATNLKEAWKSCSSLTSFPLINTSSVTNFYQTWYNCSSLTSFPLIDTSSGTNFYAAWNNCSSLTSFPLLDTSSATSFQSTWFGCSSLTSFPLLDTSSVTNFYRAWFNCTSLTSFPLIDTSSGTNFFEPWRGCTSLTSFPLLDTSSGTSFEGAWFNCTSLTTFPANFFDSWTGTPSDNCFVNAWDNCSSLTATSVENILNSIDTSGQSAPASGVDITIDYDAGTGTPSVSTAVTNLKSRSWTITLNGVAQ